MQTITKTNPEAGFDWQEKPKPSVGPNDVCIKVTHTGICGTDLHIVEWDAWSQSRIKPPLTFGHEFCGVIDTVGEQVKHLETGQYVTAEMHLPCGNCTACKQGVLHICQNLVIAGVDRDGCFAQYIVLPQEQVIKLPDSIPKEVAACMDAIGNAVHTASKTEIKSKNVLVTGCGPIGLFAIATAKALEAKAVYASDVQPFRLDLAKKMGATQTINVAEQNLVKTLAADVAEGGNKQGIDVVLEMSGHPKAIEDCFSVLNPGGVMVCLGIPPKPISLDLPKHLLFKEITIIGVTGRHMFKTWDLMLKLITSGKLDVTPAITHQFNASQFGQALEVMQAGQTGKVILSW